MKVGAINWAPGARTLVDCAYFHERRHGSYRDMLLIKVVTPSQKGIGSETASQGIASRLTPGSTQVRGLAKKKFKKNCSSLSQQKGAHTT